MTTRPIARELCSVALGAVLTGACSNVSSSGTAGAASTASTSGGGPFTAEGAWLVNMAPGGGNCLLPILQETFGEVNATSFPLVLSDGQSASTEGNAKPSISCSVSGTSTFSVAATSVDVSKSLTITIPAITIGATKASPAQGEVGFSSAELTAGATYQTPPGMLCDFYFIPGGGETVASGKIWGAFTCATVESAISGSTCAMPESYFLFENCSP